MINFEDLDHRYKNCPLGTPDQLVGMYPLGEGGLVEAAYRHYFELKHLKKLVSFSKQWEILELGCGNGRWALSLAPLVRHYTGVDVSPKALQIARKNLLSKKINNIALYESSVLEFKSDRQYDFIYFSGMSQYLQDDELRTVLKSLTRNFKQNTIIVDRSSVHCLRRDIIERTDYYSVLRTPQEIKNIYAEGNFQFKYSNRSYRYLRGGKYLQRNFSHSLPAFIEVTQPVSFYLMYGASYLTDLVCPSSLDVSHDFFLFQRCRKE